MLFYGIALYVEVKLLGIGRPVCCLIGGRSGHYSFMLEVKGSIWM
jgi:hypothetical protein